MTTVALILNHQHYAAHYDAWLKYRSRWRRFATPLAVAWLAVSGAGVIWLPRAPVFTAVLLLSAVVNAVDTLTYRTRWIRKQVSRQSPGKRVEYVFDNDEVTIVTPDSNGTVKYRAFKDVVATPAGMFLVPETGISMFIPRGVFRTVDEYHHVSSMIAARVSGEA